MEQVNHRDHIEIQILKPGDAMDEWNAFVTTSPQGHIFSRSWWLDAVCPGSYEILLLRKDHEISAGLPMRRLKKFGMNIINHPPLTPMLGVLLPPASSLNYQKNLSWEMGTLKTLVKAIPKVNLFSISFHYNFQNWLPFYWARYQQTTCYSYIIEDLRDPENIFAEFAHSKRKNIKKAETLVEVRENLDPDRFYEHHVSSLKKQRNHILYNKSLFLRLHDAAYTRNAGKTWYAVDDKNRLHAAIFVVFDEKSAWFLISSVDPDCSSSGALTLLVKHAITFVAPLTARFDFEGSMNENIESSFRHFGARQVSYFHISKADNIMKPLLTIRKQFVKY